MSNSPPRKPRPLEAWQLSDPSYAITTRRRARQQIHDVPDRRNSVKAKIDPIRPGADISPSNEAVTASESDEETQEASQLNGEGKLRHRPEGLILCHKQGLKLTFRRGPINSPPPTAAAQEFSSSDTGTIRAESPISPPATASAETFPAPQVLVDQVYAPVLSVDVCACNEYLLGAEPSMSGQLYLDTFLQLLFPEIDEILFAVDNMPHAVYMQDTIEHCIGVLLAITHMTLALPYSPPSGSNTKTSFEQLDNAIYHLFIARVKLIPDGVGTDVVPNMYCTEHLEWFNALDEELQATSVPLVDLDEDTAEHIRGQWPHLTESIKWAKEFRQHAAGQRLRGLKWRIPFGSK